MNDAFLYETFIPSAIVLGLAFLVAEFIGRSRHIGFWWTFFTMFAIIPGLIAVATSPSAKNEPIKKSRVYFYWGLLIGIPLIYYCYNISNSSLSFGAPQFFVMISLSSSNFYLYILAEKEVINSNPKYYFDTINSDRTTETKSSFHNDISTINEIKTTKKLNFEEFIKDLESLNKSGYLTDSELNEKLNNIKNIEKSDSYKRLKNLYENGILTKDEFIRKTNQINT